MDRGEGIYLCERAQVCHAEMALCNGQRAAQDLPGPLLLQAALLYNAGLKSIELCLKTRLCPTIMPGTDSANWDQPPGRPSPACVSHLSLFDTLATLVSRVMPAKSP